MERCAWCHSKDAPLRTIALEQGKTKEEALVCSDACEAAYREFWEYAEANVVPFFVGIFGLPLIGGAVSLLMLKVDEGGFGLFLVFASLGAVMIKYPFATPQTFALLGARRTIALVKWMGWALIAGGAITAVLAWLL